ncbi:MAG: hypothetical protein Salg2KO_03090 [Salibacteraceae bacterium]
MRNITFITTTLVFVSCQPKHEIINELRNETGRTIEIAISEAGSQGGPEPVGLGETYTLYVHQQESIDAADCPGQRPRVRGYRVTDGDTMYWLHEFLDTAAWEMKREQPEGIRKKERLVCTCVLE